MSYCLDLLIGFDCVEVDHGGRLTAMGGMGWLVVIEETIRRLVDVWESEEATQGISAFLNKRLAKWR